MLKLVNDNDDSDIDVAIKRLASEVVKEVNNIECDKTQYTTRLHRETIEDCVSDTLMRFLSKLQCIKQTEWYTTSISNRKHSHQCFEKLSNSSSDSMGRTHEKFKGLSQQYE